MGRTRKEAQLQAAENALRNLESKNHVIYFITGLSVLVMCNSAIRSKPMYLLYIWLYSAHSYKRS